MNNPFLDREIMNQVTKRMLEIENQLKRDLLVNNPKGLKAFKDKYGAATFRDVASMLARKEWNAKH